jgi:hypothetical protein
MSYCVHLLAIGTCIVAIMIYNGNTSSTRHNMLSNHLWTTLLVAKTTKFIKCHKLWMIWMHFWFWFWSKQSIVANNNHIYNLKPYCNWIGGYKSFLPCCHKTIEWKSQKWLIWNQVVITWVGMDRIPYNVILWSRKNIGLFFNIYINWGDVFNFKVNIFLLLCHLIYGKQWKHS